jgi:hypothetical protein
MTYRTIEGTLNPDGTVSLPPGELPQNPVRVMVTLLEDADAALTEPGDYLDQLTAYEERLARGEVQWQ